MFHPMGSSVAGSVRACTVVVPVCGGREWCAPCFESILNADDSSLRILAVDNASEDGTRDWLRELAQREPRIDLIEQDRNHGFAHACNRGVEAARTPYVCLLNSDTIAPRGLWTRLQRVYTRTPRIGFVAPMSNHVIRIQELRLLPGEAPEDVERVAARVLTERHDQAEEVHVLSGLCLFTERARYLELGGLCEDYGLGNFEDEDLSLRTRLAGLRLMIAHDAYLYHAGAKTFRRLGVDYERQIHEQSQLHRDRWCEHPLFALEEALQRGRAEAARGALARIYPTSPEWFWAQRGRAILESQQGQDAAALNAWDEFLRAHPGHWGGVSGRILTLLALERYEQADALAEELLRLPAFAGERHARLRCALAGHAEARGLLERAEHGYRAAFEQAPRFLPALAGLVALWTRQQRWQEIASLAAMLPDIPQDGDLLSNLGVAAYHLGNRAEALRHLRAGAKLAGPESVAARNLSQVEARDARERHGAGSY